MTAALLDRLTHECHIFEMIHVDRSLNPRPAVLSHEPNSQAQQELAQAKVHFKKHRKRSSKKRFDFKVYMRREVRAALVQLFHGKCAYCESIVTGVTSI